MTNLYLIVILTLFFEARGEPWGGKLAVASVIANRAQERGLTIEQVCLQPHQFSCWRDGGKQLLAQYKSGECQKNPAWQDCQKVAEMLLTGRLPETKFNHFFNPQLCDPNWAKKMKNVTKIGRHTFGTLR